MPLSEHEQQLLDQMEQALYAEDPRFATQMQGAAKRQSHTRHLVGLVGVLLGLALVVLGINTNWIIGGVGFAVMVAALAYAFAPPRKTKTPDLGTVRSDGSIRSSSPKAAKARRKVGHSGGGFMDRLEERWDRRKGQW